MQFLAPLYRRINAVASHPHAPWILLAWSVLEGFIFPLPPEVLLVPMVLSNRDKAVWFSTLSLIGSLCGASIGYMLGHLVFAKISPLLHMLGWNAAIAAQVSHLQQVAQHSPWHAFFLLVCVGFTPIPLKIFTWASGIVGVPLLAFILSMLIGRAKRVYSLAAVVTWGGKRAGTLSVGWARRCIGLILVIIVVLSAWMIGKIQTG